MCCSCVRYPIERICTEQEVDFLYFYLPEDLDIVLTLRDDKTFQIKDEFGRQTMLQKGKYRYSEKNIILEADTSNLDLMQSQLYVIAPSDSVCYYNIGNGLSYKMKLSSFRPIYVDTIKVIDNNTISFRGLEFHSLKEKYSIDKKVEYAYKYFNEVLGTHFLGTFNGDSVAAYEWTEKIIKSPVERRSFR